MVVALNRITRRTCGQIDVLQAQDELKKIDLQDAFDVLQQSFFEKPAQQIILDLKKLQVLSQGTQELLRKLVRHFQCQPVPVVLTGTAHLSSSALFEITQGAPVFESFAEAEYYYGVEKAMIKNESFDQIELPKGEKKQTDLDTFLFQSEKKVNKEELPENDNLEQEPDTMGIQRETEIHPATDGKQALLESDLDSGSLHPKPDGESDSRPDGSSTEQDLSLHGEETEGCNGSPTDLDMHSESREALGKVSDLSTEAEFGDSDPPSLRPGGLLLILLTVLAALLMVLSLPVLDEEDLWNTVWEESPLRLVTRWLHQPSPQESQETPAEIQAALESGNLEDLRRIMNAETDLESRDSRGYTPLMKAVIYRNPELLKLLLDLGAEPNVSDQQGDTPLVWAASQNEPELLILLLQHGADPNRGMFNALMWTAFHGNLVMFQLLLDHGADPNLRSREGWSVLMWAAEQGHQPLVKRLLRVGSGLDLQNNEGYTALMLATKRGRSAVVRTLLEAGADPSISGFDRKTALDLALENRRTELTPLLQR